MKENGRPFIMGARLRLELGRISEMEVVLYRSGSGPAWNDAGVLAMDKTPKPRDLWMAPAQGRPSRQELVAAANSYFDSAQRRQGALSAHRRLRPAGERRLHHRRHAGDDRRHLAGAYRCRAGDVHPQLDLHAGRVRSGMFPNFIRNRPAPRFVISGFRLPDLSPKPTTCAGKGRQKDRMIIVHLPWKGIQAAGGGGPLGALKDERREDRHRPLLLVDHGAPGPDMRHPGWCRRAAASPASARISSAVRFVMASSP